MIPYARQSISEEDIESVINVLRSDFLTQGKKIPEFEKAISEYTQSKYAIAVNSGTASLHIACLALGLKSGDWLWTSAITFVASANCGLYCNAKVDFIDIDPITWNLDVNKLEQKLIKAETLGVLPKVVVVVHLAGEACDMLAIKKLSERYGFFIIEDASHAIGGKYKTKPIGNCEFSDITTFSFHAVKNMTTGEGGAAVTNNKKYDELMRLFRTHGITRDQDKLTSVINEPWYYEQLQLGFNYRMTDIQAALGISQLKRLDEFIEKRHEVASIYNAELSKLPLKLPHFANDNLSALHLYVIRLRTKKVNLSRNKLFLSLRAKKIGVNLHYIPVYRQPYYRQLGFEFSNYPEAERYYSEAISLPIFPGLENEQQKYIIQTLKELIH